MVRYATREELERVNELRKIVNEVHCNGRPDIFKAGFCKELREFVYTLWEGNNSDVIVVLRDNEICGYACVDYVDRPESPYNLAIRFDHNLKKVLQLFLFTLITIHFRYLCESLLKVLRCLPEFL